MSKWPSVWPAPSNTDGSVKVAKIKAIIPPTCESDLLAPPFSSFTLKVIYIKMTYLCDIPKGSKIRILKDIGSVVVTFDHLDGMYSYCVADEGQEDAGKVINLSRFTPLEQANDGYYEIVSGDKLK